MQEVHVACPCCKNKRLFDANLDTEGIIKIKSLYFSAIFSKFIFRVPPSVKFRALYYSLVPSTHNPEFSVYPTLEVIYGNLV